MKLIPTGVVLLILLLCNVVGFAVWYVAKMFVFSNVTFSGNLGNLGSALVTYSTAMMALIIAMVIVLFGINNARLKNFKDAGYITATYILYMMVFLELGVTIALSFLCLSNIQSISIASYALTFALITFLLVCVLAIQLIGLKKQELMEQDKVDDFNRRLAQNKSNHP